MLKKNKSISIRLSEHQHELLKKTGYKPYDIIEMFLDKYYNTTPVGLAIELDSLKSELNKMSLTEKNLKNKIFEIENKLSKYKDLNLISDSTIKLIKIAISKYLDKSIKYHNISEFLEDNQELVIVQSNKTGYSIDEYKKLVTDYYNKHY
jgi:hypothetical protein